MKTKQNKTKKCLSLFNGDDDNNYNDRTKKVFFYLNKIIVIHHIVLSLFFFFGFWRIQNRDDGRCQTRTVHVKCEPRKKEQQNTTIYVWI